MYQYGFRKAVKLQHCLIAMIEKWRLRKDKNDSYRTLLTALSKKVFDCLSHELLIAKLAECGFSWSALKVMYTYLSDRNH